MSSQYDDAIIKSKHHGKTLAPALADVRGLFLLPGYEGMAELLAEAGRAGVEHVVLLSGSSAESGDMTNAVTRYMIESEDAVRASGLAWTIVRPSGFMSNTFEWTRSSRPGTRSARRSPGCRSR
ncbi:NAD(P)H-binding protein [Actinomadura sp. LD22]|uniref:NAD(P)H-binding protein n=1 Tax=Actinomadura physcomitrii TaxID=2650748 RepID=A0A6I4MBJ3_9ACTN|nr:NAD(P)H-binding protein [Actinomadura physcomitrii]MWA01161.1 NAD(P)H-binding protein [Actinomadura physcomitrii]